jgi:hypothetical protein
MRRNNGAGSQTRESKTRMKQKDDAGRKREISLGIGIT